MRTKQEKARERERKVRELITTWREKPSKRPVELEGLGFAVGSIQAFMQTNRFHTFDGKVRFRNLIQGEARVLYYACKELGYL